MKKLSEYIFKLFLCGVIFSCWYSLSLPAYVDVFIFLITVWGAWYVSSLELSLLSLSLVFSLLVLSFFFKADTFQLQRGMREHEKYALDSQYRPNVSEVLQIEYGDLVSIDPTLRGILAEPRQEQFSTDSRGFRNPHDYQGEPWILSGDSFIVGNGVDYPETLPAVLRDQWKIPTYSIGFPSKPSQYIERARVFLRDTGDMSDDVKIALFLYEGNDFGSSSTLLPTNTLSVLPGLFGALLTRYDLLRMQLFDRTIGKPSYSRAISNMSYRLEKQYFFNRTPLSAKNFIRTAKIGNKVMGFHFGQDASALNRSPSFEIPLYPDVWERVGCVFFIPSKIRVYEQWLPPGFSEGLPTPAPTLVLAQKTLSRVGLPVHDLTPLLVNAAEELLKSDQYVFWRDDTHWNGLGIQAVAEKVASCLNPP